MTIEDYLYLQYCIKEKHLSNIVFGIQRGEILLSPVEARTKEEVFEKFTCDVNYIFDRETMC